MFSSLSSRVVALATVVVVSILGLMLALVDASTQTRDSFRWVTHSADVIETTGEAMIELREAESGQRGFVLTRNPIFAQSFEERADGSLRVIGHVVSLTGDNPAQNQRAAELRSLMTQRVAALRQPFDLARRGAFDEARNVIAIGRGRDLMTRLASRAQTFLDEEHALQTARIEAANTRLATVRQLAIIGGPIIALVVLVVSAFLVRGIRRPVGLIRTAMTALGAGEHEARIAGDMGSREFSGLASGYNAMADRLDLAVADQRDFSERLGVVNAELRATGDTLRERNEVIELLGGMAHRMQAARTDDELAQVIRVFVPRVMPGIAGALYAHNNSRNLLVPIASWGGLAIGAEGFAPDQCWALRRGRSHFLHAAGEDIVCGHVGDQVPYHCEPLLAGGEVIGTLYLEGRIEQGNRFRLAVLVENIASALVNHRLQRGLREQTIRDPLTGLFNRRYMEETLAIEVARARRSGAPLSVVMCDVDHFKRFNDEFGHDAGDAVLQAVAAEMARHFRDGDVICRYGGEEFTIIAPGTAAEALRNRVEIVREAVAGLAIRQNSQRLGSVSMSFGIATWTAAMGSEGANAIQAADAALYQAKREGRNRTVVDLREAA